MNKQKQGFTLVELIVVITILAILGTIAFISLQGYSKDARNSTRITDMASMNKVLELYQLRKSKYPMVDDGTVVSYDNDILWTQGYFGSGVLKKIGKQLSEAPKDPLLDIFYTYSVTNNQKEYEILTIFEGANYVNNYLSPLNRANADSGFAPKLSGNYNGVFVKSANYIIPTPSIVNVEITEDDDLDLDNIKSQIVNGQDNMIEFGDEESETGKIEDLVFSPVNISSGSLEDKQEEILTAITNTYTATTLNQESIDYVIGGIENGNEDKIFDIVVLDKSSTASSSSSNDTSIVSVNGTCGAESKAYTYSDTNYASNDFCGEGNVTGGGTPAFPAEGGNTTWTCEGLNGGNVSTQCEVTRTSTPVNGTCGTANNGYLYSDTSYGSDSFCGEGNVTGGGTPIFPTEGGNTTWTCDGLDGGNISVQCEATRTAAPFPITGCGNGTVITAQDAIDNKAMIISNITNYVGCEISAYAGISIPGGGVYIAGLTNNDDIMVVSKSDISGTKVWKTDKIITDGTISLTDGVENTNAMFTAGISLHPAGESCRNIGTTWYLPAKNELNTIYINRSKLGTFASTYWSSTGSSPNNAWWHSFVYNVQATNYIKNYFSVRCVSKF